MHTIYLLDKFLLGMFCGSYRNGISLTSPFTTTTVKMIVWTGNLRLRNPFRGFNATYRISGKY